MRALSLILLSLFTFSALGSTVNLEQSSLTWTGKKKVGSKHTGNISFKSTDLKTDKDGKVIGGTFVVDMNSMTVDELEGEWKDKFLNHMKSEDFFDVKNHGEAKLVINKITGGVAHGELTVRGKTNKVEIPFKEKDGTYQGTLKFDRTKYGLIYGSKNFFKELVGDKIIENEITLDFKLKVDQSSDAKKTAKK